MQSEITRHDDSGDVKMTLIEVAKLDAMRGEIARMRDLIAAMYVATEEKPLKAEHNEYLRAIMQSPRGQGGVR